MVFLDTNVLLYSISRKSDELRKRDQARRLIDDGGCALSVQVLQEFFVQATRPTRVDRISADDALVFLDSWRRFQIVDITAAIFDAAIAIHQRQRFSYWDSAIVAAARSIGCSVLYTEDMDDGRVIDDMTIRNPFLVDASR